MLPFLPRAAQTFLVLSIFGASLFCLASKAESHVDLKYVTELKARAESQNLHLARRWLLVGHYRPRMGGGFASEIDAADFFLHPRGRRDPRAELIATLDAMAAPLVNQDEKDHAQCRYPSRRNILFAELKIDEMRWPRLPCTELTAWKSQLNAEGLSLIFASAYLSNAASMFGHTFFKFHGRDNRDDRDLLNYGVNFAAHTGNDGGLPFALFGLAGGYRGHYSLLPYHQMIRDYANLEGRDIFEYRLNLKPEELDLILDHLLEIQRAYFDYYFFDENCSYQLLWLLELARPDLHLANQFFYFVIPADTVRVVTRIPGLVTQIIYRPSLATLFHEDAKNLDVDESRLAQGLTRATLPHVDAGLSELAARPKDSQVEVLDSALGYAAILAAKKPAEWKDRLHLLKTKRAALGVPTTARDPASVGASRPEEGHDPSQLGLAVGAFNGHGYTQLHARAAYHHLLSSDVGYLENTQLEVARLGLRRYDSPQVVRLQEFTVLDITSLSPVSLFFQPLAWRVDAGWSRAPDREFDSTSVLGLNGGLGYGVELLGRKRALFFGFIQTHVDAAGDLERGYRIGPGAQLNLLVRPHSRWRLLASAEYREYLLGERNSVPLFKVQNGFSFGRNWELRLEWQESRSRAQIQALALTHFIF